MFVIFWVFVVFWGCVLRKKHKRIRKNLKVGVKEEYWVLKKKKRAGKWLSALFSLTLIKASFLFLRRIGFLEGVEISW